MEQSAPKPPPPPPPPAPSSTAAAPSSTHSISTTAAEATAAATFLAKHIEAGKNKQTTKSNTKLRPIIRPRSRSLTPSVLVNTSALADGDAAELGGYDDDGADEDADADDDEFGSGEGDNGDRPSLLSVVIKKMDDISESLDTRHGDMMHRHIGVGDWEAHPPTVSCCLRYPSLKALRERKAREELDDKHEQPSESESDSEDDASAYGMAYGDAEETGYQVAKLTRVSLGSKLTMFSTTAAP